MTKRTWRHGTAVARQLQRCGPIVTLFRRRRASPCSPTMNEVGPSCESSKQRVSAAAVLIVVGDNQEEEEQAGVGGRRAADEAGS